MTDPTGRNGYPLSDDLRETMASALGMDVDEGWMAITLTLLEFTTTGSVSPRTWSLPAEPGPEVTAVRDRRGFRWTRVPDYPGWWHAESVTDVNGCYPQDRTDEWGEVLAWHGPVTDATDAAGEQS